MKIVVFGLTITSSWGNGHATTYRSLLRALAQRGHRITFIEKDVEWYSSNRDLPKPEFCTVSLYEEWERNSAALLAACSDADVIVVGSYFPDAIAATTALLDAVRCPILFYDIDTPITMQQLRSHGSTAYLTAALIPHYAAYLSFTGGPALQELEQVFGAQRAIAFYCSVDPELYRPVTARAEFACDLSYLGTYAADRQPKLMHLLNDAAALAPQQTFVVAGPQYPDDAIRWQSNVRRMVHVAPRDHPAFYCSSRFTLNVTRDDMVMAGYSPSVRLFEASACGAAILSDSWPGLTEFLTPVEEILLPENAAEVARLLKETGDPERMRIGQQARARVLATHSSEHRAEQFEQIVSSLG